MPKKCVIVLIVGFEACGKSELSKRIAERLEPCIVIDDFLMLHSGLRSVSGISESMHYERLKQEASSCNNIVLNDVTLCYFPVFQRVVSELDELYTDHSQVVVVFENSPNTAIENAVRRNRLNLSNDLDWIRHRSKRYKPDMYSGDNVLRVPVFNFDEPHDPIPEIMSLITRTLA